MPLLVACCTFPESQCNPAEPSGETGVLHLNLPLYLMRCLQKHARNLDREFRMTNFAQAGTIETVTCPSCGLLCDDLKIERSGSGALKILSNGCPRSVAFFERPPQDAAPRINGRPASLQEAVAAAGAILQAAHLPLIAGLATEVQGMRAVMNLAETAGATLDHMNSSGFMRNIQVVQNSGWFTTTLTEVRNRVELLLVVGTDIVGAFPRFFERNVWNKETLYGQDTAKREVVYLGGRDLDTRAGVAPDGRQPDVLPCDPERLPEVAAALRALVAGKKLAAAEVAGIATADLERLAQRLRDSRYSVVAWAVGQLDFPHAELTVQNLAEMVKTLNLTTRSAGLPLGGNDGDLSANQVCTWISGYPTRTSYARRYPEHDPHHFSADRLLASGEADALLWLSTFGPERTPPASELPTVVIGHAGLQFEREPAVYIPVGVPGIDHRGIMFRSDSVVSLPLQQLRQSPLPTLAQVLEAIEQTLPGKVQ